MNDFEEEKKIATGNLKIADVPSGRIYLSKFSTFALTFDPRSESLTPDEILCVSKGRTIIEHEVKILRAFLYNWQRIQNNKTYEPSSELLLKVQEVIGWIREKTLANGGVG